MRLSLKLGLQYYFLFHILILSVKGQYLRDLIPLSQSVKNALIGSSGEVFVKVISENGISVCEGELINN